MLTTVSGADNAGWRPKHYAALSGNVDVVEGLLQLRANPNQRTSRDVPQLGLPLWMSPLDLVFYKHNEAAQLLLAARAHMEGGVGPALHWACNANNAVGARLLCCAGSSPLARNLLGPNALDCAGAFGSMAALEEMLQHCHPTSLDASRALLSCSDGGRGASAKMVQRLIDLRADVNFQRNLRRDWTLLGRMLFSAQALKHRFGTKTVGSTRAYHASGSTALMWALVSAQYEGAAALLAAGARLDICNCRGWRAADFVKGLSIPSFLQQGLEEDPSECRRVACLALSDDDVFEI